MDYAGLVKTLEKLFKRKLGPLPGTPQAGACIPQLLYFPAPSEVK